MKCPACGTRDAYIGLNTVECIKVDCVYYSEQQWNIIWEDMLSGTTMDPKSEDTPPYGFRVIK